MSFTIPNVQDASYRAQAAPDSGDFRIALDAVLGNGVLLGCAVTPQAIPDMTVAVAVGTVIIGGVAVAVAGGNAVVQAAEALSRFDLVTVTGAGAIVVVKGTAAAVAVFPATTDVVLAAVYVPAATTAINAARLVDKRAMVSGGAPAASDTQVLFKDGTVIGGSADFVFNKTLKQIVIESDLILQRDAAGVLALRNGTSPQAARVYASFTNASNFDRLTLGVHDGIFFVGAEKYSAGALVNGTMRTIIHGNGAPAGLEIRNRWDITSGSWGFLTTALAPAVDSTTDFGTSALRVKTGFFGGTAAAVGIVVKAHASQTANLQEWQNSSGTALVAITKDGYLNVGANQIVSARKTGWGAPTGTPTRTAFDTATVTLPQLAERLKALIDDLTSHGLVGA